LALAIALFWTGIAAAQDDEYEPSDDVPPPDDSYTGGFHAEWASGWTFNDYTEHDSFGVTGPPPQTSTPQTHQFPSRVTAGLSSDGGATFRCVSAPAQTSVKLSLTNSVGCTNFYSTEMTQLDISGGSLPPGIMFRQSPTKRSLGQLTVQPAAGGGYLMNSFFDVWPELSTDGGTTWMLPTNVTRMSLTNKSPEVFSTTNRLPPMSKTYNSLANRVAIYCTNGSCCSGGIIVSNIFHHGFTSNQPPPPLGSNSLESFSSTVDFQLSMDGGATFSQQHAPANVTVQVNHTKDVNGTQFFDTQMLQLDISGGTLPPQIQVRASPSQPSLGKTHIRPVAGGFMIKSWFDINTELSMDNGVTWIPSCCPERMGLLLTNYPTTVESINPVGYWRLSETTQPPFGGTAVNLGSLGSGADGTYIGGTPGVRGALVGSQDTAVRFNGGVTVPFAAAFGVNAPFTIEAWLRATTTTTGNSCPLSCGTFGINLSGWLISQNGASGWNFSMFTGTGSATAVNINAGGPTIPGAWYHVAAVYNGPTATLYVNGLGQTATLSGPFAPNPYGPLTLGMRSDTNSFWSGSVDEVAFYQNALPAPTIMSHYSDGTNTIPPIPYDQLIQSSSPLIYLRLDEPYSLPITVNLGLVGTNANGQFEFGAFPGVPGVPFSGFGHNNYGCGFDGMSGYVDIPSPSLNLTGPITIMTWALPNPADGNFHTIVGRGDTSYRLDIDSIGLPRFADGSSNPDVVGSNRIDDGQWHFLAGVYDGLSVNRLYVDGLLTASGTATNHVSGSPFDLWIGGAPDYGPFRLFNGLVDEVSVFSNALTAPQIQQIFQSAFTGQTPGPGVGNVSVMLTNALGAQVQLSWPCGILQSAPLVSGPYTDVSNAPSPYTLPATNAGRFFRVRQ
jgi:hypothetical protein